MGAEFSKENVSLPIAMNKKILRVTGSVVGIFTDKNLYSVIFQGPTTPSSITTSAVRLSPTAQTITYEKIYGNTIIIGC